MEEDVNLDAFQTSPTPNEKNEVVYAIIQTGNAGKAYTDLMGWFPYRSDRGNNYLYVT